MRRARPQRRSLVVPIARYVGRDCEWARGDCAGTIGRDSDRVLHPLEKMNHESASPRGSRFRAGRISTRLLFGVGLAFLAAVLEGATEPRQTPPRVDDGVDIAVHPGDDFFAYANGAWLKATALPTGRNRWTARDEIAAQTKRQMAELLASAQQAAPGSTARKIGDYRAAFLDTAAIEARGIAPLQPLLQRIDALGDKGALADWLGAELRADCDPLNSGVFSSPHVFGFAVQFGIRGDGRHHAYLLQGGLGLGAAEAYTAETAEAVESRARYASGIAATLRRLGCDRAEERARAVLALETELARTHVSDEKSANERNADQVWLRSDFPARAPGLDWEKFFRAAGLEATPEIAVWQPAAVTGIAAQIDAQPLAVWQDYLRFHLVQRHADVLPAEFAAARAEPAAARPQLALAELERALPELLGRAYVEKFFPPEAKVRVQAVADDVLAHFQRRVATARWLSSEGRRRALEILRVAHFSAGHPETWVDDSALTVARDDAFGNRRRVAEWRHRAALARLDRPVDLREWTMSPHQSGAVINLLLNSYNFAAALLQPPKFDPAASRAALYGSIGAIFAHEMCHFVDTLGADYDAGGALRNWWTDADRAAYAAATQPLIAQFAACRAADLPLDGQRTLVENFADLAGLELAFEAHRHALGARAADAEYARAQNREFFIAFARAWRAKTDEAGLRRQVQTDNHAPEAFRAATARNLDAWYDAFDTRPGDRLYLAPDARVRLW